MVEVNEKLNENRYLEEYKYLVTLVVNKMNIAIPSGLNKEDFIGYGLNGLYKAIKTYDKSKSSFEVYARNKIRNEIIDNIRAYSITPRSVLDKKKKVLKAMGELESKLGRCPSKAELMEYLEVDESKYKKLMESFTYGTDFSLNDVFQDSHDEVEEFCDLKKNDLFATIEQEEFNKYLVECLDGLKENARQVMYLRYYHGLTYKEIAKIVGLSESTVGEIHNRTLVFLRAKIKEDNML